MNISSRKSAKIVIDVARLTLIPSRWTKMTSSDEPPAAEGVTAEVNSYSIRMRKSWLNLSGAPDITRRRYMPEKSLKSVKSTTNKANTHQWSARVIGPCGMSSCISRQSIYPTPIRPNRIGQMTIEGLKREATERFSETVLLVLLIGYQAS